jgi:hypothetical protein
MIKFILLIPLVFLFASTSSAQQKKMVKPVREFVDLTGTIGNDQGSAAISFVHNWGMGKKKKFELGVGGRFTTYFGEKKDFITAGPASLTRSFSFPVLIVFAGFNEENLDTLTVQRPLITSINASFNLGYHFTARFYGGVNIDVIGFSFGRKSSAILTSNGTTQTDHEAKPSTFNLLLTGDHDLGSLNSEFFIRYKFADKWSLKVLYQFIFAEYETQNIVQVAPDGTEVDRFRNKANNVGVGIVYHIK